MDFIYAAAIFGIFVLISLLIDRGKRDGRILKRLRTMGQTPRQQPDDFGFRRVSTFFRSMGKRMPDTLSMTPPGMTWIWISSIL